MIIIIYANVISLMHQNATIHVTEVDKMYIIG